MTSALFEEIAFNPLQSDEHFDSLYPRHIQDLSDRHWTPVAVAAFAADFLAEKAGTRILDIGSGVGKFCLAGAYRRTKSQFFGVEQRKELVHLSEKAREKIAVENAAFIHGNFTQLDLDKFDHFYFYNSFYENLVDERYYIDESIDHSVSLYEYYTQNLYRMLNERPAGTRLVTYHSFREVVPDTYHLAETMDDALVRCWIKE